MSSLRTRLLLVCLGLASAASAIPYPGYFFPSSMQQGTKTRVLVGGVMMGGVKNAYITGGGVKVTRIVVVPGFPRAPGKTQPGWIMNWYYDLLEDKLPASKRHRELPPEALTEDSDWQECLWWPYLDERDDIEMQIVGRWWCTPERYPQATPALDQIVLLDVEVDKDAKPGRRDIILLDGGSASAPHSFFITKEPHVCERFFVAPTREQYHRRRLPAALHIPTKFDVLTPPIHIDGQAWPGETDSYQLRLKKGQHLVCDVKGREFMPFQGDAVPGWFNPVLRLYDKNNHEVAFADDYYYLPDPVLTYTVPEDGIYRLDIHDNLYRGRQDCVYMISCFLHDDDRVPFTPQERAFECFPPAASHEVPKADGKTVVKKGVIDYPGRVDRYYFDVKDPGTAMKFELFSRRRGSPLDGVLKLYGPMGTLPLSAAPLCAEWDDYPNALYVLKNVGDDDKPIIKTNMVYVGSVTQFEIDPVGTWKFREPGRYCITVGDSSGFGGGEDYGYELAMSPLKPSFEVYASTSAFLSHPGGSAARFKACVVRRNGFTGPITFDSTDEFEVSGEFPEGEVETDVTVNSLKADWSGVRVVQLTASGELPDGEKLTVRVTPCDPAEQAFAYTHYLPQIGFFFCSPGESLRQPEPHPLPHLNNSEALSAKAGDGKDGKDGKGAAAMKTKKPQTHSNGRACLDCHDKKKKGQRHTHGKACTSCHEGK